MPCELRVEYPDAMYHAMRWGDRGENIFLEDVDGEDFVKTLAESCWNLNRDKPCYGLTPFSVETQNFTATT